jgi:23S rRNA U2552 (ribose-2'-O)-methylase RlmE/FtsJ
MHIVAPKITYDDIPLWRAKAYEQLNTLQQHTSFPQFNIGPLNILGDDYIDGVILNSVALDQPVLISCPTSAHYTPGNRLRLDHYYRQYGYYSSAHYKVVEILIREKIVPTQVMCLAEGSGSIAASFLKLYPSVRKLYYNSLHAPEEFTPHRITSYMPICLDDIDPSRLINLTASVVANNDLTKMYTVHDIIKQTEGFNMDVITCDAEYGAKGTIRMFLLIVAGALKICASKLISSGTLIYKTFSHDRVLLDTSLRMIRVLFSKVKVVYPLYASPNSGECYIVATNLKDGLRNAVYDHDYNTHFLVTSVELPETKELNDFIDFSYKYSAYQIIDIYASRYLHDLASQYEETVVGKSYAQYFSLMVRDEVPNPKMISHRLKRLKQICILNCKERVIAHKHTLQVKQIAMATRETRDLASVTAVISNLCDVIIRVNVLSELIDITPPRIAHIESIIRSNTMQPLLVYLFKKLTYSYSTTYEDFCAHSSRHLCHIIGYMDKWWKID